MTKSVSAASLLRWAVSGDLDDRIEGGSGLVKQGDWCMVTCGVSLFRGVLACCDTLATIRRFPLLQGAGEEKHRDKTALDGMPEPLGHAVGAKVRLIPFRQ